MRHSLLLFAVLLMAGLQAADAVVPQSRVFNVSGVDAPVEITDVSANIQILEQAAETTLEVGLHNPGSTRREAELLLPVPDGAVVRGFTFQGGGSEPSAQLLPTDEARKTYETIVNKVKDPALLEFAGCKMIRSSVFPVEPNGTQRIRLVYEHLCPVEGSRMDYVLPRSESLENKVPWNISVKISSKRAIATVYSPSHQMDVHQANANSLTAKILESAKLEPGSFRLSCLFSEEGVSASMFAYPDPKVGGGYFLLVAGVPAGAAKTADVKIKREITMVIDRSGSMNGEKIEQVREAALQLVSSLDDGEAFNIILFNESVESFAKVPVTKTKETEAAARAYIKLIRAGGGTNIYDALQEALQPKPAEGSLPIVIFLTDGLPTSGQTSEAAIRELATKSNPHQRRIFTFGVGLDVNTPLLERIAASTRASTEIVLPKEDVEVKVGAVIRHLNGPVIAHPQLETTDANGAVSPGRVRDVVPSILPDIYDGDQLVLLGQYVGDKPLNFTLSGNYLGHERTFKFNFPLDSATTRNAFVPRLWASRRIAVLVEAIRELGADASHAAATAKANDPRVKELVTEIVRLSKEYGVLTEYTSFLALEGTDLSRKDDVLAHTRDNLQQRAMETRSGMMSWNQESNLQTQSKQYTMNHYNGYLDDKLDRVSTSTVQQVADKTFYRRDNRWVDGSVLGSEKNAPDEVVEFGSEAYKKLTEKLTKEGRQGCISLRGEVLLKVDDRTILCK